MLRAFLNAATRKGYSPLRAYVNESGNHSSRHGELHYMCFLVAGLSLHSRVPHPCAFQGCGFSPDSSQNFALKATRHPEGICRGCRNNLSLHFIARNSIDEDFSPRRNP
jgi:hypothetical protein